MKRGKQKRLARPILGICSFLLVLAGLFFSLRWLLHDEAFFHREYTKLDHARFMGMQTQDLTAATMQMIYYMEGTAKSIDIDVEVNGQRVSMFNDRERAHMVDVRVLYQGWRTASFVFLGFYALVALYGLLGPHKWRAHTFALVFLRASAVFACVLLFIGLWVLIDFNSFWNSFHLLFFTNDLWLLDPATSRMINMMPLALFYDIVGSMALRFVLPWGVLLVICYVLRRRYKQKQKRYSRDLMRRAAHAYVHAENERRAGEE